MVPPLPNKPNLKANSSPELMAFLFFEVPKVTAVQNCTINIVFTMWAQSFVSSNLEKQDLRAELPKNLFKTETSSAVL